MIIPRRYYIGLAFICMSTILFSTLYLRHDQPGTPQIITDLHDKIEPPPYSGPKYKDLPTFKSPPIKDNFPLALAAHSAADLPPIPSWSRPPAIHVKERTPLFIGFTRNWRLLQQVVVSYITAGWPAEDIYVVENTGVMDSNRRGLLDLQNPFFLNHTRLSLLGVNVLITPTLFSFAQLQNFYLWTSISEEYPYYFWSHMDVVVVPYEQNYVKEHPEFDASKPQAEYIGFKSVYTWCIEALREVLVAVDEKTGKPLKWAMRFFSYDRLALVNVEAFKQVGGWDSQIPFYTTDCDMHARLEMEKYSIEEKPAGMIYDVGGSLEDLSVLYRKVKAPGRKEIPKAEFKDPKAEAEELSAIAKSEMEMKSAGLTPRTESEGMFDQHSTTLSSRTEWVEDTLDSPLFADLFHTMEHMQNSKLTGDRNQWQAQQTGGQGDPFYRDSKGFDEAIQMTIEHGRHIFREKWGHRDCDIVAKGLRPEDAWRVVHDGDW